MSQDGKYQKQSLAGSGERVDVFLGLNVAFDRQVAIKELRGGIETSDAERKAFYNDYEQWAKLDHPRLARIAEIDRTHAWVIQEYLPHAISDLAGTLASDINAAYTAMEQLLEGLEFLHSKGLMHCNLKDSNVRFLNGSLRICDGRCVRIGFPGSLPKPRGSNRYLAPEMINEEFGSVGTASDIYVAGIILLEALAGDRFDSLFQGYVSGTPDAEMGWVRWHNSPDPLDPIHSTVPSIPEPLANILDGMLCKEVRTRHASADRLLFELRASRELILNASTVPSSAPVPVGQQAGDKPLAKADPNQLQDVKLIDRPTSAMYVRCLSGPLAGSIFPLSMGEVVIGTTENCNVRLSGEEYPGLRSREVHIALGTNGWKIFDPQHHPLIVDLKKSFDPAPIRSGSIFRVASRGPDFQFIIQGEHDWSWQDIASELELFSPETHSVPKRLMKGEGKKIHRSPSPSAFASTSKPIQPSAAAPAPPPQHVATKKGNRQKSAAQPTPASQQPTTSAPAPPPSAAASSSNASAPVRPPGERQQTESLVERFKNMDKNKRNNLVLILGLPIVAILVILLVPRANSDDSPQTEPTEVFEAQDDSRSDNSTPKASDEKPVGQTDSDTGTASDRNSGDRPDADFAATGKMAPSGDQSP